VCAFSASPTNRTCGALAYSYGKSIHLDVCLIPELYVYLIQRYFNQ